MTDTSTDHAAPSSDIGNQEHFLSSPSLPSFISYKEIPLDLLFPEPVLEILDTIAHIRIPLLVSGEQGLGQSYLAHLIHETVTDNPESLLELHLDENASAQTLSTLFRKIPGNKPFRGTLHVHSIENTSYTLQKQLLQLLEEQQLEDKDCKKIFFEGRLAAYIYKPLEIARSHIVPELLYKLSIAPLQLTPLRERQRDITRLADLFAQECAKRLKLASRQLLPDALQRLQCYPWPGNIPELECVLYRSMLCAKHPVLAAADIVFEPELKKKLWDTGLDTNETSRIVAPQQEPTPAAPAPAPVLPSLSVGHLVGELSHEIKNPLVAIKTFIQLLPGHLNDPEFLSEFFSVAARSIDRIDYLAERLYEFAKFTAPSFSAIKLPALIAEVLNSDDAHIQKLSADIDADIPENLPAVRADREHLLYSLQNILLHIAHNADSDKQVRIGLHQENSSVIMSVAYSGKKQVQGVAFANSRGEGIRDLKGLDLFLAEQILEKNAVQFSAGGDRYYACITLQFPANPHAVQGDAVT